MPLLQLVNLNMARPASVCTHVFFLAVELSSCAVDQSPCQVGGYPNPQTCVTVCLSMQLSSYAGVVDYSPSESASISARLELISKLARRFRAVGGASGLLELQQQWTTQLEQYYASQGMARGGGGGGVGVGGGGGGGEWGG